MNDEKILAQLNEYYATLKEADALYGLLAKESGLSDATLWVLYSIRQMEGECTQKTVVEQWAMSKQTVHSAVNDLLREGLIMLFPSAKDRRRKRIVLTEAGVAFAEKNIDTIYDLECAAFGQLGEEERRNLINAGRRYLELFRREVLSYLK
ncbi:MAG TPA: MarR family winged helix-turn-helix transcriptional regulator [Clostridiales bacterium]|nr:MarR family winged helix-turn-helix transcriptional regulator [Clostridiales bacterium]